MYLHFIAPALFIAILIASCSNEAVVETEMLEITEGLYFLQDSDEPFSGKAVSSYPNGQPESELNLQNGILSGLVKYWYADGLVKLEINIADKLLDGKYYYQEDDYIYDSVYADGVLVSREIQYQLAENTVTQSYADNMLSAVETNAEGEIVGISEQAYAENSIVSVSVGNNFLVVSFRDDDQLSGRLFFQNGEVIFQENYVNGELSILLYHDRVAGNIIFHCYYEGSELQSVSDAICTNLPARPQE